MTHQDGAVRLLWRELMLAIFKANNNTDIPQNLAEAEDVSAFAELRFAKEYYDTLTLADECERKMCGCQGSHIIVPGDDSITMYWVSFLDEFNETVSCELVYDDKGHLHRVLRYEDDHMIDCPEIIPTFLAVVLLDTRIPEQNISMAEFEELVETLPDDLCPKIEL